MKKRIISLLLCAVLLLGVLPPGLAAPAGDADEAAALPGELFGGPVTCAGLTGEVVEAHDNPNPSLSGVISMTIHFSFEQTLPVGEYYWLLYSPTTRDFAKDYTGNNIIYTYQSNPNKILDPETGYDLELNYRDDGVKDYRLTCIHLPQDELMLGSVYLYRGFSIDELLTASKQSITIGIKTSGPRGTHFFTPRSDVFQAENDDTLRYDGSSVYSDSNGNSGKMEFQLLFPDELPQAAELGYYHLFWAADGELQLAGWQEGRRYLVAAYSQTGQLLQAVELMDTQQGYLDGELTAETMAEAESLKLFIIDQNFTPLAAAQAIQEIYFTQAQSVDRIKGTASIDVSGTNTRGDATLIWSSADPIDDAYTLGVVEASIVGNGESAGQLDGIAVIRIPYDKNKTHLDASTLLPGWYNPDTEEWETIPYIVDEENHQVIILTDHLSKFGLFEIEGTRTRTAFAKPLDACVLAQMTNEQVQAVLAPYMEATPDAYSEDTMAMVLQALDDSFNGNWAFGIQTTNTLGSGGGTIKTGIIGSFGKACTVVGIVSACLSATNNYYKYGIADERTLKAVGNAAVGVGVGFATAEIQLAALGANILDMVFNIPKQQAIAERNRELDRLFYRFTNYPNFAGPAFSKWTLVEWREDVLDPLYERYYLNGTGTASERYAAFRREAQREIKEAAFLLEDIYDYCAETLGRTGSYRYNNYTEAEDGYNTGYSTKYTYNRWGYYDLAEYYSKSIDIPKPTRETVNYVHSLCQNYYAELCSRLKPYFQQQALQFYHDAVIELQEECERIRQEINQTITINVQETAAEGEPLWSSNCKIALGPRTNYSGYEWEAAFDDTGKASLTFTGTGYLTLGAPMNLDIYNRSTGDFVGSIPLNAEDLDYGEDNHITFDRSNIQFAAIRILEEKTGDDYVYANCKVRIRGQSGPVLDETDGERNDSPNTPGSFKLNDEGFTAFAVPLDIYEQMEGPTYLDILDPTGKAIKTLPFNIHSQTIILRATDLTVNVTCADDDAVKHYVGAKIILCAFPNGGGRRDLAQGQIAADGTATLLLNQTAYDFFSDGDAKTLALDVWTNIDGLEVLENRVNLVFDDAGVCNVELSYSPPTTVNEPLALSTTKVRVYVGKSTPIEVLAGQVGDIRSEDSSIATGSSSSISGLKAGTTTIYYTDLANPSHVIQVSVSVVGNGDVPEDWGFYRQVPISRAWVSYGNNPGSGVEYRPDLSTTTPYRKCYFSRGLNQITKEYYSPSANDFEKKNYRPNPELDDSKLYYYYPSTGHYMENEWAEIQSWPSEEPIPSSFTVTERAYVYSSGRLISETTIVTRYELVGYRSWDEVYALNSDG